MIIDVHVHPFCQEATVLPSHQEAGRRLLASLGDPGLIERAAQGFATLFTQRSLRDILTAMDQAKVDKACLVPMDLRTKYGVQLVTNQDVARMAKEHPDRFIPFAGVDPSLGRLAVDELIFAVKELGCRGLKLVPPLQFFDFSDLRFEPLWQAAEDLDIIVWTHTAHQRSIPGSDARYGHPMLVEPVALKHPRLKIVLGHCGFPWVWETWSLVVRHPHVYLDVSAYPQLYEHVPWDAYLKSGAEDKLLFASDFPLRGFEETLSGVAALPVPAEVKDKILGLNAARLLRI